MTVRELRLRLRGLKPDMPVQIRNECTGEEYKVAFMGVAEFNGELSFCIMPSCYVSEELEHEM